MSHENLVALSEGLKAVGATLLSATSSGNNSSSSSSGKGANYAASSIKESPSAREISYLKSQIKGMEVLLSQNAQLEREVNRLCDELATATNNVIKRGYLYKWRDREISFASKWGLRYFVLQGSTLSYFGDANEQRPRRTFDLSRCVVRSEGTKRQGAFHVFSIYVINKAADASPNLLLRLSSENAVEATQWMEMLEQACALAEINLALEGAESAERAHSRNPNRGPTDSSSSSSSSFSFSSSSYSSSSSSSSDSAGLEDWSNVPIDPVAIADAVVDDVDSDLLSPIMLKRVRSSSAMLRKIHSRQTLAREILARRSPHDFAVLGSSSSGKSTTAARTAGAGSSLGHSGKSRNSGQNFVVPKTFPGSKPMHVQSNPSPLSNDVLPGEQNYRGFFNLGVIILLLSHARLIIDSHVKYGFVPAWRGLKESSSSDPAQWALSKPGLSVIHWAVMVLVSYVLEYLGSLELIPERGMLLLNILVGTVNIVLPTLWVWQSQAHPGACMTYLFQSVILWMKLISYAHANRDLRKSRREARALKRVARERNESEDRDAVLDDNSKPVDVDALSEVKDLKPPFLRYPQNVNLPNLMWFCIAPTLTYQLNYPTTASTRWRHVLSIIFRIGIVTGLILFSIEQYIVPTLESSMSPLKNRHVGEIAERVIKLSIPNTYVWLLVFYLYFHLWLNLLAELTCFGDRAFYKDWWNARTIETYWRNWNLPVHHWMLRHLYYPTLRAGAPKVVATFVVFFFSAIAHELILSVPFRKITFHAFLGMLAQAPLTYVTKLVDKRFESAFLGNCLFWVCFCAVGQPMGLILFAYDNFKLRGALGEG